MDFALSNNSIINYVVTHHVDKYFSKLAIEIIEKENITEKHLINFLSVYNKIGDVFLNEICKVRTESFYQISLEEIDKIIYRYSNLIQRAKNYYSYFCSFLNIDTTLKSSSQLFQKTIYEAYNVYFGRLEKTISSKEYFSCDTIKTELATILVFHLTPFGILKREQLISLHFSLTPNLGKLIDNAFLTYKIVRIQDKEIIAQQKTRLIFKKDNIDGLFVFQKNTNIPKAYLLGKEFNDSAECLLEIGSINFMLILPS